MILFPILLALQSAPPPPQPTMDNTPAPWPDPERGGKAVDAYSVESEAEARLTLMRFAGCVAESSAQTTAEVLTRDFRTSSYRNALRNLSRANEGCARKVRLNGRMRMANLAFAGALAEALIARQGAPANVLLARAAAGQPAVSYSVTDRVAMCVVRSVPDQVAGLFGAAPESSGEEAAIAALGAPARLCAEAAHVSEPLSFSPAGLRAALATAAYRSIAGLEGRPDA